MVRQLQALLCGTLQTIIVKMEGKVKDSADTLMRLFITLLTPDASTVREEALMAIGVLANGKFSLFVVVVLFTLLF